MKVIDTILNKTKSAWEEVGSLWDKTGYLRISYPGKIWKREKIPFEVPKIDLGFFTKKKRDEKLQELVKEEIITKYNYDQGNTVKVERNLDPYKLMIALEFS